LPPYGDLFFINSSMTLSRILRRHAVQSSNIVAEPGSKVRVGHKKIGTPKMKC
jgi:hypothetical protein